MGIRLGILKGELPALSRAAFASGPGDLGGRCPFN